MMSIQRLRFKKRLVRKVVAVYAIRGIFLLFPSEQVQPGFVYTL